MKKLFELVGIISIDGLEVVKKGISSIDRRVKKALRPIDRYGKQVSGLGMQITKGFTVPLLAAGSAAYKGTKLASDLAETTSKVGQIFGESGDEIVNWSKKSDKAFGQSKTQAMDAAATFAIFGKSAGLTDEELVNFSTDFVKLASDLASFNNTKPEEAITAIGAALRGENEPIRRYGVLLDDATMRQEAFKMGLIETTKKALTPQVKVLAAQSLIYKQTKDAQGDFKRTSGELANQTRILKAEVENLATEWGQTFLPIAKNLTTIFRTDILPTIKNLVDWWGNLSTTTQENIVKLSAILLIVGPVIVILGKLLSSVMLISTALNAAKLAVIGFNAALLSNPFSIAVLGIAALSGAIIGLVKEYKNLIQQHKKYSIMTTDEAERKAFINGVNEVINKIKSYGDAVKEESDLNKLLGKEINELTTKAREMGYVIEGNITTKLKAINVISQELQGVYDSMGALVKYVAEEKKAAKSKKETIDLTEEQIEAAKKLKLARDDMIKEYQQKLNDIIYSESELLDIEEGQAMKKAKSLKVSEEEMDKIRNYYYMRRVELINKVTEAEHIASIQSYEDKKLLAEKEERENEEKRLREISQRNEMYNKIIQFTSNAFNTLSSIFTQSSKNKMITLDNEKKKQIENINSSILSEEEKSIKIAEIEDKMDIKKKELMAKQAKRDKSASLFSAAISAIQLAISGFQTKPFLPLGLIMGGIATVLGTALVAKLAAQPLPELAEGALVRNVNGGRVVKVAEGKEDEAILPMKLGAIELADRMIERLAAEGSTMSTTTTNNNDNSNRTEYVNHWHIGVLVADEEGLKELERKQYPYRVQEANRKGI